nr:ARMT1-like domain-containing protein [Candidatus Kapabacteria bacterium]
DFGTQKEIDIKDVYKKSESTLFEIDGRRHLQSDIKNSDMILYLGDNCGEIVFDKLLISTIKKEFPDKKIIFAVRSAPIINDITIEDAEYVRMSELAEVIANGYDAPGTILEFCSDEFLDIYRNADLIISKGQGNYEGLSDETENIFFLLTAKCDVVAESLGAKVGDSIVAHAWVR